MKKLFFLLCLVLSVTILQAQPGFDEDDVQDVEVPFDGGLTVLIATGLAYGAKKLHEMKNT